MVQVLLLFHMMGYFFLTLKTYTDQLINLVCLGVEASGGPLKASLTLFVDLLMLPVDLLTHMGPKKCQSIH